MQIKGSVIFDQEMNALEILMVYVAYFVPVALILHYQAGGRISKRRLGWLVAAGQFKQH